MKQFITQENLDRFSTDFHGNRTNRIAMNAVMANGLAQSAKSTMQERKHLHQYSIQLDSRTPTAQKSSGRCWLFAALNCLRLQIIRDLNLSEFELSQNYIHFYDKLEKANYFIESVYETLEEPDGSRLLAFLMKSPMQDGGQWDMVRGLIQKYGVVPKSAMPESCCSSNTMETNKLITENLRSFAARIRAAYAAGVGISRLREEKKAMLSKVYRMLCICLGMPPKTFDFEIRAKDGTYIADRGLSPQIFYDRYVGVDLSQYVSLIHSPTADKPYMRSYTVAYLGSIYGEPVRYVNLPIKELKRAACAQLRDGEPVWFGCDVGKMSHRDSGVMDLGLYDYGTLFSTEFDLTKGEMLDYGFSKMSHAMVFQGVDLDEAGRPIRWCVENSWGTDCGEKGMYMMSDGWFDRYMYQVVVKRQYLSDEILRAYEEDPIVLAPWDPMGALA